MKSLEETEEIYLSRGLVKFFTGQEIKTGGKTCLVYCWVTTAEYEKLFSLYKEKNYDRKNTF